MSYHVANGLKAAAIAAIAALGLSATAPAASADVVLKYSPWLPDGYPLNDAVLRPWIKEVERITEGRVKVDWLPKAVGSAKAQFDAVHDGLADMSLILPGYTPGRFELLELGELPLLSSSTAVVGPTFYDIYAKHLEPLQPFKGTHVISLWATIPTKIVVNTGIVKSVDDLSGLKLRAPSATAVAAMKALGAVPIQKSVSEMYELASTGIIDGTFFPVSTTYNFKVDGFLKYTTMVPGGMGQSVMVLLVNQDKWDAISEDEPRRHHGDLGSGHGQGRGRPVGGRRGRRHRADPDGTPRRYRGRQPGADRRDHGRAATDLRRLVRAGQGQGPGRSGRRARRVPCGDGGCREDQLT